ncbi:patatin-like phospholipase family protein [Tepidibacter sp. Z1-5]|uniref:patatin-like phospholipase family protein n=1 Tax=Tepidibacter sp. Z1-5 TaxID=3134138 RepID=UPI0030BFD903
MLGVCLPGGGAKGAFSAGVIYGLYEKGIKFDIVTGTSIGAINGYFIYTANVRKLKELWISIDDNEIINQKFCGKVIDNSQLINNLNNLDVDIQYNTDLYVNYVNVKDNKLREIVTNVKGYNKQLALSYIKYSSLLPCKIDEEVSFEQLIRTFDSKEVFDTFKQDVLNSEYEGYNLDGGILNNNLLSPFIYKKVNKLFIIALRKGYIIPEYILEYYNKEDIIVIEPDTDMKPSDTLRFKKDFCKELFYEGYKKVFLQKI